jgi:hypothetical protein
MKEERSNHEIRNKLQVFEMREHVMLIMFPWLVTGRVPSPEQTYELAKWLSKKLINGKKK